MLFLLRHKAPSVGIVEGLIEIDDPKLCTLEEAERVGRKLCEDEPGYLFIGVRHAILNKRPKTVEDDQFRAVQKSN